MLSYVRKWIILTSDLISFHSGPPSRGSSVYNKTPMYGSQTPMYGAQTPMHGSRTPMYGSQTPTHGEGMTKLMYSSVFVKYYAVNINSYFFLVTGSRTPHYGSMTPSHDPSRTPLHGGAWDPTQPNTPARNEEYDYNFDTSTPSPGVSYGLSCCLCHWDPVLITI